MEFLERVERSGREEVWLVRAADGSIGTAHVFDDHDDYNDQISSGTRPWLAFRHPRVVPLLALSPSPIHATPRLIITSGDERGVMITRAAKHLAEASIPTEVREAWAIAEIASIAEAIAAMAEHAPGFVHARANPEQIVVGGDGLARLRAPIAQVHVGPIPNYLGRGPEITGFAWMSPEQVRGLRLTPAADVFQLATTLYTLLTGERLARGDSDFEVLQSIIDSTPPRSPNVTTPGLAFVVLRGLSRDPSERFANPAAFAVALRALPPGDPSAAYLALAGTQRHPAPSRSAPIDSGRCHKQWDELATTHADGIRYCATCRHDVVRVSSVLALVPLLGKRCVAFQSDDN